MYEFLDILNKIWIWFIIFVSVLSIVKGYIEYKVFMTFEDKDLNLIVRFIGLIAFGISNLIFYFFVKN